jgi:hypothetical protein
MDQTFVNDLDNVLDTLYDHQVSLERKTIAQNKAAGDPNAGPATIPHYYCVDEATLLASAYARPGRADNSPFVFRFISEQLYNDGLIWREFGQGEHGHTHYHITAKGKLFKEEGGYHRQGRDLRWAKARNIASTALSVSNTIAILVITFIALLYQSRSVSADEADTLKDEQIIQLERRNTLLEERNTKLENSLIMPDKDTMR